MVEGDPTRVIVVPGNHDVDWQQSNITWPLEFERTQPDGSKNGESFLRNMLEHRGWGGRSKIRMRISPGGHMQWLVRENVPEYHARFCNFQECLLDPLYGGELAEKHGRKFDLRGKDDQHWSAHIFEKHRVAVFGFNSCSRNDKYWSGADIHVDAITSAAEYMSEAISDPDNPFDQGFLCVAVWHHGFASDDPARPDYLPLSRAGNLQDAGFEIGMHGHTHKEDSSVRELAGGKLLVTSIGSLGAPSRQRPGSVGNQFSLTTLNRNFVRLDLYESDERHQYSRRPRHIVLSRSGHSTARKRVATTAKLFAKHWEVDEWGVGQLNVSISGIRGTGDLPLFLRKIPGGELRPVKERGETVERRVGERQVLYAVNRGKNFRCKFYGANVSALCSNELLLRQQKRHVPAGWEALSHAIRFDTDTFEMSIRLPDNPAICGGIDDVQVFVEAMGNRLDGWTRDSEAEAVLARMGALNRRSDHDVTLRVPEPEVGKRYGIAYKLREVRPSLPAPALNLLSEIIDVLSFEVNHSGVSDSLHHAVATSLARVGFEFSPSSVFACYLWSHSERVLRPVCGRFPNAVWADRFPHGRGLVGQAFRFGSMSGYEFWGRKLNSPHFWVDTSVPSLRDDYSWICAVPIRVRVDGGTHPVGVVGIAGSSQSTDVERLVGSVLNQTAQNLGTRRGSQELETLDITLNASFWAATLETCGDLLGRGPTSLVRKHLANLNQSLK